MAKSKESINFEIEYIREKIRNKKDEIIELEKKLEVKFEELHKLEIYEQLPIEERTLEEYIFNTTSSVRLMDEFETLTEEGFKKYTRLVIKNGFLNFRYKFIIERLGNRKARGDITITDFKKGYNADLIEYANEQIALYLKGNVEKNGMEILFEEPYLLRAQNSSNRTGYGREYNGSDLVWQGTLYGETTEYAFVGVIKDEEYM